MNRQPREQLKKKEEKEKRTAAADSPHYQQEGIRSFMPPPFRLTAEPVQAKNEEEKETPVQEKKDNKKTYADGVGGDAEGTPNLPPAENNSYTAVQKKNSERKIRPFQFKKNINYQPRPEPQRVKPFQLKGTIHDKGPVQKKKIVPYQFKKSAHYVERPEPPLTVPFQFKGYNMSRPKPKQVAPFRPNKKTQMPKAVQGKMEQAFDQDFSEVNIHTNSKQADDLGALAYAQGNDVHFAPGQFKPESEKGQELLGHELTHVVQQREGKVQPTTQGKGLPVNDDAGLEKEADDMGKLAAQGKKTGKTSTTGTPSKTSKQFKVVQKTEAEGAATESPTTENANEPTEEAAASMPTSVTRLTTGSFLPEKEVADWIEAGDQRSGVDVKVAFGSIAEGIIKVKKHSNGHYETKGKNKIQVLDLKLPVLAPLTEQGVRPVLAISITGSQITGFASIAMGKSAGSEKQLAKWIQDNMSSMGWLGIEMSKPGDNVLNEIQGANLRFGLNGLPVKLGGFIDGTLDFGFSNETVTFNAQGTIKIPKLNAAEINIGRGDDGSLTGQVALSVAMDNFSGAINASYMKGAFNIEGDVRYDTEKMSGTIHLVVTNAKAANQLAMDQLDASQINQSAVDTASLDKGVTTKGGPRAVAGWGELDFRFSEWMTGKAKVIVDGEGYVTVQGNITPPAEVELFKQKDTVKRLAKVEARARYGVPVVGNVFVYAKIGLDMIGKIGPGKIYNIKVDGTYSTNPKIHNRFELGASLNISAYAGARLRAEGGAGIELADHDIKIGVGINALAGVRGYVDATPTIGYRETDAAKEGEFFFNGRMELAAQPFLGLGGDLFVDLDSPWWSPAPDKRWTWPIGSLEYPLPGEIGIGADVDYVIGSGKVPKVEIEKIDFDEKKFMTDLMDDKVSRGGGKSNQKKPGTFVDANGGKGKGGSGGQGLGKQEGQEETVEKGTAQVPAGKGGKQEGKPSSELQQTRNKTEADVKAGRINTKQPIEGKKHSFTADGESHEMWILIKNGEADIMVASKPMTLVERLKFWRKELSKGNGMPKSVKKKIKPLLTKAENMTTKAEDKIDVNQNDLEEIMKLRNKLEVSNFFKNKKNAGVKKLMVVIRDLFELFGPKSWIDVHLDKHFVKRGKPDTLIKYAEDHREEIKIIGYIYVLKNEAYYIKRKSTLKLDEVHFDEKGILKPGPKKDYDKKSDADKIKDYNEFWKKVISVVNWRKNPAMIKAEKENNSTAFRQAMRAQIIRAKNAAQMDKILQATKGTPDSSSLRGKIFEVWCLENNEKLGKPVFIVGKEEVIPDGLIQEELKNKINVNSIVEVKYRLNKIGRDGKEVGKGPDSNDFAQMMMYKKIIDSRPPLVYKIAGKLEPKKKISKVVYKINNKLALDKWKKALDEIFGKGSNKYSISVG